MIGWMGWIRIDSCICIEYGFLLSHMVWFLYSIYVEFSCIFLLSIVGLFIALLDWDGWGNKQHKYCIYSKIMVNGVHVPLRRKSVQSTCIISQEVVPLTGACLRFIC